MSAVLVLPIKAAPAQGRQFLPGHVPEMAKHLAPTGRLPGETQLRLAIGLPLRNQAELDALLRQLYDPASPNYRRYLTPEEFTARFGPTEQDYQALIDFAGANGLAVTHAHPNRLVLDVAGAVAEIEKTFNVTLRVYRHPTEARTFYAPDAEPSFEFAQPILHISGLDNYSIPHPNSVTQPARALANATPNAGSGPSGSYQGSDFRNAYVPGTALDGTGQSIGLLQFDGFYTTDIINYETQAGLPDVPLTVVPVDGGVRRPGNGASEVSLDIEMVISMAPGLARVYVFEAPNPSPWVDLLNAMVAYTNVYQFSCSWGGGSPDATAEGIFKQMAAQGQSFFNATGDSDAFTGSIPFPSDSPNITQVGGTTLTTGTGATYSSETVWNWGGGTGSSGGVSTYYDIPSYQLGISMAANQGSTTMRNVPDVALTGDNVYVIYSNGKTGIFGGTSCAAPLWAGFTALVNQQATAGGSSPVGFLNPALYTIGTSASYAADFHDTTTGNNFSSSSPTKFAAVAGYDLCTGWGTPNGTNLINTLAAPPVPTPLLVSNSFTLMAESCSNGVVDPAETVSVSFGLKNTGTGNTTNLVATLLAAGGVLSPSGPQTYGAIIAGGAAVSRTFTFMAIGACGGSVAAVLQLQDGTNYLGTVTNSFTLGALGSPIVANYSSGGVTVAIPDKTTVEVPIAITDDGIVADVNVRVRLNHTRDSDLVISLVHPDGTVITLANGRGDKGDNYGSGATNCSGTFTVFDDDASTSIASGTAPFAGTYQPEQLLSGFKGKSVTGTWKLRVADTATSQTGTIYCFQLDITRQVYACCTGTSTDLGLVLTDAPDPVIVGSNLTYSLTVTNLGPATATNVTVTDALPAGVVFVSASVSQGTWATNGGSLFTCALGDVNPNDSATVSLVVRPNSAGSITNTATAASSTADPNSANNAATAMTVANVTPPTVTQSPQPQNVCAGATATFTVAATGAGPLSYQWQMNNLNLTNGGHYGGVTSSNLTVSGADSSVLGNYRCVVSNQGGSTPSSAAALTISDPTPPTITCPADVTVSANSGCNATNVTLGSPVTGDNCGVAAVTNNGLWSYPLGTNVVTWTVTDTSGNSNSCHQRVIVVDSQAPRITWYMTNVVVAAGTNCQASMPDITGTNYILAVDNCSFVTVTQSVAANVLLSRGTHEVVLGAFDAAGNVAYCTNYFVVADQTPPTITCPTNIVVSADVGQCSKSNVTWEVAASDNCAVTNVVSEPPSGSTFPGGVTTVRCTATDASGKTNSCTFTVTVIAPVHILAQPTSQTVTQGQEAPFIVTATNNCGSGLTYQWRWNGGEIAGATDSACTRTNVQCADAGSFDVVVAGAGSSQTSSVAILVVVAPPVILSGPTGQTVAVGQGAILCVSATNDCGSPLSYQWRFQELDIPGATADCYALTSVRPTNSGNYDVVVANLAAAVTSPAAALTVVGPYVTVYPVEASQTAGGMTKFVFVFPSVSGVEYVVEYKDALPDTNSWLPLTTNSGTGGLLTNDFPITTDLPGRFYRILVP